MLALHFRDASRRAAGCAMMRRDPACAKPSYRMLRISGSEGLPPDHRGPAAGPQDTAQWCLPVIMLELVSALILC